MLNDVILPEGSQLISLDIVALYPSIPLAKALEIVRSELMKDHTLGSRTKWSVDQIMRLLEISLETYFKTLDGRIFQQINGTPIGKAISGPIAGIYMNWFESTFVLREELQFKPVLWKRMRDDILLIWNQDSEKLSEFIEYLNGKEPRIQFTVEKEVNGSLPFLDLLIMREEDKIMTKVYRKPSHTQRYINWRSNHPKNNLLGVLKSLIHRAHAFCDKKNDLLDELALLKDVFVSNGYPSHLVQKTIDESWQLEIKKQLENVRIREDGIADQRRNNFNDIFHAPYVQGLSENLQRQLRPLNVGFVPMKGDTIGTMICKHKPKEPIENIKDVIYGIQCETCGKWYIGETGQKFKDRKRQHMRDVMKGNDKNGIANHLLIHPDHKISWENFKIIDKQEDWIRRKITESLYINSLNPGENIQESLNIEKGRKIDKCWLSFNSDIRKNLQQKLQQTKKGEG
jgi:hypothetical protein